MGDIDEELLEDLYGWVDQIPLSRPKKDIKRDFSDGGRAANLVIAKIWLLPGYYYPCYFFHILPPEGADTQQADKTSNQDGAGCLHHPR